MYIYILAYLELIIGWFIMAYLYTPKRSLGASQSIKER